MGIALLNPSCADFDALTQLALALQGVIPFLDRNGTFPLKGGNSGCF